MMRSSLGVMDRLEKGGYSPGESPPVSSVSSRLVQSGGRNASKIQRQENSDPSNGWNNQVYSEYVDATNAYGSFPVDNERDVLGKSYLSRRDAPGRTQQQITPLPSHSSVSPHSKKSFPRDVEIGRDADTQSDIIIDEAFKLPKSFNETRAGFITAVVIVLADLVLLTLYHYIFFSKDEPGEDSNLFAVRLVDSIYFGVVTFSTVGFGDHTNSQDKNPMSLALLSTLIWSGFLACFWAITVLAPVIRQVVQSTGGMRTTSYVRAGEVCLLLLIGTAGFYYLEENAQGDMGIVVDEHDPSLLSSSSSTSPDDTTSSTSGVGAGDGTPLTTSLDETRSNPPGAGGDDDPPSSSFITKASAFSASGVAGSSSSSSASSTTRGNTLGSTGDVQNVEQQDITTDKNKSEEEFSAVDNDVNKNKNSNDELAQEADFENEVTDTFSGATADVVGGEVDQDSRNKPKLFIDERPFSVKLARSFQFATVAMTTIGYGHIVPVTLSGKVFASVYLLCATCVTSLVIGTIFESISEEQKQRSIVHLFASVHRQNLMEAMQKKQQETLTEAEYLYYMLEKAELLDRETMKALRESFSRVEHEKKRGTVHVSKLQDELIAGLAEGRGHTMTKSKSGKSSQKNSLWQSEHFQLRPHQ